MIAQTLLELPHGIRLSCRSVGLPGQPVIVFLHGFPEAAFIWDATLEHFAARGFRCVAPNLRGFEKSSSPADVAQYRAKHLVQDIVALMAIESPNQPLAALVAHDWGGAVAWNLANQMPQLLRKLCIINSPHPGTFLRGLKSDPAQQAASSYMNFLCRPDAEALLAEDDFRRLFEFFSRLGAVDGKYAWLDDATKAQYREMWSQGLTGGCNYYRASPLKPPLDEKSAIHGIEIPHEALTVNVPTQVIWGMQDPALPPGLINGLEAYIPDLQIHRVDDATHWIIHEQPARVRRLLSELIN
ncbi:MAG: alpha/beta fold hydrolase [Brachymonas sp.]